MTVHTLGVSSENRIFGLSFTKATKGASTALYQSCSQEIRKHGCPNGKLYINGAMHTVHEIPTLMNICSLYYNKVCTASAILSLTHMYKITTLSLYGIELMNEYHYLHCTHGPSCFNSIRCALVLQVATMCHRWVSHIELSWASVYKHLLAPHPFTLCDGALPTTFNLLVKYVTSLEDPTTPSEKDGLAGQASTSLLPNKATTSLLA